MKILDAEARDIHVCGFLFGIGHVNMRYGGWLKVIKGFKTGPASCLVSRNTALSAVDYLDQVCLVNTELQRQVGPKHRGIKAWIWAPLLSDARQYKIRISDREASFKMSISF